MLPMMKELLSKNVNVLLFIVTIQDSPSAHSHFEHFVSFPAFDKAKNAHMWREPYSDLNVQKSRSLTCKHDDSLISAHSIRNSYFWFNLFIIWFLDCQ